MLIDIVIVSYNSAEFIGDCLRSIESQTIRSSLTVTVLDNGSTDGTAEVARAILGPSDRFLEVSLNLGFGASTNIGLQLGTSPAVLLLNPDCFLSDPRLLEVLLVRFDDPAVGVVSPLLRTLDGRVDPACARTLPTLFSAAARFAPGGVAERRLPKDVRYNVTDLERERAVEAVNGAFMLVRRSAMVEVGLLDVAFWMYGEDLDWCKRFGERGWKIVLVPDQSAVHLKGGSSGSYRGLRTNYWFHRSMQIYYFKHLRRGRAANVAVATAVWLRFIGTGARNTFARALRLRSQAIGSR